jgi:hypothetical protein
MTDARRLEEIDPKADLLVSLDSARGIAGFSDGRGLQMNWDDRQLAHVGFLYIPNPGWQKIICPDDTFILVRFLSIKCQFLTGEIMKPQLAEGNMPPKAPAPKAPPKKGAVTAPVKPAKPAAKAPVKEAKAPASASPTRGMFKDMTTTQVLAKLHADGHIEEMGPKLKGFITSFVDAGVSKDYAWLPKRFSAAAVELYKK